MKFSSFPVIVISAIFIKKNAVQIFIYFVYIYFLCVNSIHIFYPFLYKLLIFYFLRFTAFYILGRLAKGFFCETLYKVCFSVFASNDTEVTVINMPLLYCRATNHLFRSNKNPCPGCILPWALLPCFFTRSEEWFIPSINQGWKKKWDRFLWTSGNTVSLWAVGLERKGLEEMIAT